MGVRGVHAGGEQADPRQRARFGHRIARPQPKALAKVGQNGGILSDVLATLQPEGRRASRPLGHSRASTRQRSPDHLFLEWSAQKLAYRAGKFERLVEWLAVRR